MSSLLVRNVNPETIERLKIRATLHQVSMQTEVKNILERTAASYAYVELRQVLTGLHKCLKQRKQSDSAALLREDRHR